jgi:hypothetical protein
MLSRICRALPLWLGVVLLSLVPPSFAAEQDQARPGVVTATDVWLIVPDPNFPEFDACIEIHRPQQVRYVFLGSGSSAALIWLPGQQAPRYVSRLIVHFPRDPNDHCAVG